MVCTPMGRPPDVGVCSICLRGSWARPRASGIWTKCSAASAPTRAFGRPPAAKSSTGSRRSQADGEHHMALAPRRFDYAPITERPVITWPGNARVAFWVAPNMEFFEYLPENRPTQPDIPHYSRMDYGNRVGFWRMPEVLNKHN